MQIKLMLMGHLFLDFFGGILSLILFVRNSIVVGLDFQAIGSNNSLQGFGQCSPINFVFF